MLTEAEFRAVKSKAEQGETNSQFRLAVHYLTDTETGPQPSAAYEWARKAAEANQEDAEQFLAKSPGWQSPTSPHAENQGLTIPRLTLAAGLGAIILLLWALSPPKPTSRSYQNNVALPVEDKLVGSTIGSPAGIRWIHSLGDRGAAFSSVLSSRIEYPGLIPHEGTLEFWIKVDDGYHYENSYLKAKQNDAMIFSSDAQGGDVIWPGTTKIFVGRRGRVSLWMATNKYNKPSSPETEARNTKFRFGEWHAIGVSYGRQGQYIMLDGKLVASAPTRTQTFGVAGNHQQPLDIPTIGETVSHFWSPHRYEGGFEGILAAFRVSGNQQDWVLAKGVKASGTITEDGIRTVDFSNFDYPSDCWKYYANSGFDNSIHVTNGAWAKGKNSETSFDEIYFGTVGKPVFGDLTASGQEEAVVQTSCGFTAGNAGTDEVFVFGMTEGKPQLLSKLSWIDWQTPNEIPFDVQKVEIQSGELLVTYRSGGSHAQPAFAATATFKWDGSRFVRTGIVHSPLPVVLPSQPADGTPTTSDVHQPPTVIGSARGQDQYTLELNQSQQSAVSLFVASHPGVQAANCQTLGYATDACREAYSEWKSIVLNAKAEEQYPYAAWGDFNRDGLPDFVVPFFGRTSVNNWGWRNWYLVVFQGTPDGHFTPVVAAEDQWGPCFDGMLYHPVRQQIEYWCKSAGGSFRWDGSRYISKRMIGD